MKTTKKKEEEEEEEKVIHLNSPKSSCAYLTGHTLHLQCNRLYTLRQENIPTVSRPVSAGTVMQLCLM